MSQQYSRKSGRARTIRREKRVSAGKPTKKRSSPKPVKRESSKRTRAESQEKKQRSEAAKRGHETRRKKEAALAHKRREAAKKARATKARRVKKAKPRQKPKTKRELQRQNKLLQKKLQKFERERKTKKYPTKKGRERKRKDLEAERKKHFLEVATREKVVKKPKKERKKQRLQKEQQAFLEEKMGEFSSNLMEKIEDLRDRGKLPELPVKEKKIVSDYQYGLEQTLEINLEITPDSIDGIVEDVDKVSFDVESKFGEADTWMTVFALVAYGPDLLAYGVHMAESDDPDEAQIQVGGIVQTGLWTTRSAMVTACRVELAKAVDRSAVIFCLWATIHAKNIKAKEGEET